MFTKEKDAPKNGVIPDPKDAATVILLREAAEAGFEVYLMRRHKNQSFMGGAFVFPGGRLDEADCDPLLAGHVCGLTGEPPVKSFNEQDLDGDKALGLYFTAIRETFEEAGVLSAQYKSGQSVDFNNEAEALRFAGHRKMLHEGRISLLDIADKENLLFSLDMLVPYAHWITPEVESKRFDTRFFIARPPKGQTPIHDSVEMTESLWITPQEALERQGRGQLLLMPPTLITITELALFDSIEEVFAETAKKNIQIIMPQGLSNGDAFGLKLPNDPEYSLEKYRQEPRPDECTRLFWIDGRWNLCRFDD